MLAGVVGIVSLLIGILIVSFVKRSKFDAIVSKLEDNSNDKRRLLFIIGFNVFVVYFSANSIVYASVASEPVVGEYLERLEAIFAWVFLVGFKVIILQLIWHFKNSNDDGPLSGNFRLVWIIFGFFILVWVWLSITGYGFAEETQERGVFRNLGTPIVGFQIIIALIAAVGFGTLLKVIGKQKLNIPILSNNVDKLIGILLWVAAFSLWMSSPLKANWFVDAPRAPIDMYAPNSDAYLYEAVSQSVLVGSGFTHPQWGPIVARPMYSALLALFHQLGGASYEDIIPWQVAFLAVFPVIIFFITRTLHNQISGLMAAILVIIRENNAIELADTITVSHAKLLMADLPAALGGALIILVAILWIKDPNNRKLLPLLAGGLVGFFVLIRLEIIAFLIVIPIAGMKLWRGNLSLWLRGTVLTILGFFLMVSPWVWRNWEKTQSIYIINPNYEQKIFDVFSDYGEQSEISEYSSSASRTAKLTQITNIDKDVTSLKSSNLSQWSNTEKYLHHFFNSITQSVMYLPMSPDLNFATLHLGITRQPLNWLPVCCSLEQYVRSLPYWWADWDGNLFTVSIIPMVVTIFVLAIGASILIRKEKYIGLIPIIISVSYYLFLALMGRSGGRWVQEVDWVTIIVFSIGLAGFVIWLINWVTGKRIALSIADSPNLHSPDGYSKFNLFHFALVSVGILFVGMTLPVMERFIPSRFNQNHIEQRIENLLKNENSFFSLDEEVAFRALLHENSSIWAGQALYPRYFDDGDGMDGMGGTYKRPFSRLEFFLVGTSNLWGVFPYADANVEFPHGSDVLLIGKEKQYHQLIEIDALVIYPVEETTPVEILWGNESLEDS